MRNCIPLTALVFSIAGRLAAAATVTVPNAQFTYEGLDGKWAQALAETAGAARKVYAEEFGSDVPKMIYGSVACRKGEQTRLYTDGKDHMFLYVPSVEKLAKPASSGVFNLYGMCHELGHMVMYRVLAERDWMTGAAAEGWAHYAGSVVTDRVYAAQGQALWPDPYDYRADGTARLNRQLADKSPDDVTIAAGQWQKLATILGPKGFHKVFAAWQAAKVDAANPSPALLAALVEVQPDKKDALTAWWKASESVFVQKTDRSVVKAEQIPVSRLAGKPFKLELDDGTADGKQSIAGSGHARKFSTPEAGEWYLRKVGVFGVRYGASPAGTFEIALCDEQMKPIATWKKPYAAFKTGELQWVTFDVLPTRVPKDFYVCLNFRPTATHGVFVGKDSSTSGSSLAATPGIEGKGLAQADWMIRCELDQAKPADEAAPAKK